MLDVNSEQFKKSTSQVTERLKHISFLLEDGQLNYVIILAGHKKGPFNTLWTPPDVDCHQVVGHLTIVTSNFISGLTKTSSSTSTDKDIK